MSTDAKKERPARQTSSESERAKQLEAQNRILQDEVVKLKEEFANELRRREDAENRLAYNPVTGLPTHYLLDDEVRKMIELREASGIGAAQGMGESQGPIDGEGHFAIVILQLNSSYDMIKRSLKSSVTEWVLYQVTLRIKELLQPDDKLFHTHENEFIIFINYTDIEGLEETVKKILAHHHEPHIFSGFNLTLGCSLGIALYPEHGRDKPSLLHRADIALGTAVEHKRSHLYFKPEYEKRVIERMEIQNSIIKAIEAPALREIESQFDLYFQPKIVIGSVDGDTVRASAIGAEALIRWNHPERGLMPPDKFIAIAEETGLIMPIGKWVIYQVARIMNRWSEIGLDDIKVSVNLSPRQFRSEEIIDILRSLKKADPGLPARVTLEVTETSLFEDPAKALSVIDKFKELGFRISVDDFGTGYSSLSHLHQFPIDEIKIDKTFISHFPESNKDLAIVNSLASIAENLKIDLIAEGVERQEQISALHQLKCSIQGFIFSKPLPEKAFVEWVQKVKAQDMVLSIGK
jgi:diguanylate cyclase